MKHYKFLTDDNKGEYSNFDYTEYLPDCGEPGKWLPEIEAELKMCEVGYHATTSDHLERWVNAQLFEVELGGVIIEGDDKSVATKMRFVRKIDAWNDKTARLFACWCADQVLSIFEKENPYDDRPRKAIEMARKFAEGNATTEELAAARDAARAATWAAAWDAAWAATWAAARDATWDAAWAAARDATWAAAWAAARDAARDATWDAARDATWAATWAAARAAARDKYNKKLIDMIGIG